jgi:HK97 family phage portal protein
MSFLRSMMDGARQIRADMGGTPAPWDDFWYQPIGTRSATGIRVTPESAKQISCVISCINKIAKTQAMLPLKIYTDTPDGGKKVAKNHPLFNVLYSRPNDLQTSFEWRQMMQGHLELRGNAYSEIIPSKKRAIDQLVPMHPDRVHPEQLQSGRIRYRYNDPLTSMDRFLMAEQVFHLRNFMDNGIMGQSTVTMATDTFGVALAAQDNYARFLKNDSRTQSVLTGAQFKTKQDKQAFREDWQEQHTGENRYKVGVLPVGMDIKSIGVTGKDAELLDSRKFSRIEICSLFDVPPHLIGEIEKTSSYASVEQFNIMFATYCILPRLVLWEQAIQRTLLFSDATYFPKFGMGSLLRGDTASRFNAYQVAIQNGWMSQNDVRIAEDLNPIPDGDNYWRPLNWARLGDVHTSVQPNKTGEKTGDDETETEQTTDSTTGQQGARVDERFRLLAVAGAERCVRKELAAVRRMTERDSSHEEIYEFYREHAEFIAKVLRIAPEKAQAYCARRADNSASLPDSNSSILELTTLALGGIQ